MQTIKKIILGSFLLPILSACGGGGGGAKPYVSDSPSPVTVIPPVVQAPVVLEQLRIFVIGQSISSNCNEHKFGPVENVFQIGRDGEVKPAMDPFEWADCPNGSMWMPLGKLLIERGVAKKVVFMPIGVGGTRVRDWQEGGIAFPKLTSALSLIKQKNLSFDVALWHQGSSDVGTDKAEYTTRISAVVGYVNSNMSIGRWVIALHSRCGPAYDPNIEDAQRNFANAAVERRYLGPNNNLLGAEYRASDVCHLNQRGQQEMALLWFDSIKGALRAE
jgi:hypothetical protein